MADRRRHLTDEALLALDDDAAPQPAAAEHIRGCASCQARLEELRAVRVLLEEAASRERAPGRDLVRGAVKRLRVRERSLLHVNEFFGLVVGILRGFVTLASVEEKDGNSRG